MSIGTEVDIGIGGMTGITEPAGQRDQTFYWPDNTTFSVEDVLFRVSRYPFFLGSEHFVEKHSLGTDQRGDAAPSVVQLEGVTADQFRVFLKFLFPVHLTSTTTTFSKGDWLTILTLATLWHFHEARNLAIQHLDGQLNDLELILVGRAAYVPRWLLAGYRALVDRPRSTTITEEEGDAIGYREVCRLWAIRYQQAVSIDAVRDVSVIDELHSKFSKELAELAAHDSEHRTKSDIEREEEEAEERRKREKEEREAEEERSRLEAMVEETERLEAEAKAARERLEAEAKAARERLEAEAKAKAEQQMPEEDVRARAEQQGLEEAIEKTKQRLQEQARAEQERREAKARAEQEARELADEVFKAPVPSRASVNPWESEAESRAGEDPTANDEEVDAKLVKKLERVAKKRERERDRAKKAAMADEGPATNEADGVAVALQAIAEAEEAQKKADEEKEAQEQKQAKAEERKRIAELAERDRPIIDLAPYCTSLPASKQPPSPVTVGIHSRGPKQPPPSVEVRTHSRGNRSGPLPSPSAPVGQKPTWGNPNPHPSSPLTDRSSVVMPQRAPLSTRLPAANPKPRLGLPTSPPES